MSTLIPDRHAEAPDHARGGKPDVRLVCWFFPVWYAVFGVIICVLARVTPPPRPDVSAADKVAFFAANGTTIRIGFCVLLILLGGAAITNGLVAYQMKRMSVGSVFAYAYIGGMGVGALPGFLLVAVCFLTAAFRTDRDPEMVSLLYDLGMLSYNGSLGCFSVAYLVLALAILYDRNDIFPKWFAYVSIWQIITEVIATQMFVFYSGPFAWNGSLAFWWSVVVFTVWLGVLIMLLRRATMREPLDAPPVD
ncbi:hypothetical protein ABQF17_03190 [Mycolicibacterium elephantis]|uniref:DUF4386 domain-containing protein n=1 Tax=Mycolicibacterium elephantis TaxID=81858 RepID=A0A0M2ZCW3_9MYCO|nr:hypothetical protein [Mycolicibacterium elephantis]KKW63227.1 membrane protein [Mycolicibacterium elephantis]OBA66032.1 hypothetical protein A5633_03045 [Mycolicibacterium elephantis]OBB20190.1 hypothetical protein A5762_15660 [Mycolicibacterium elephantis]OBF00974.1 hypothetical protein A5776_09175 [Mycolicibacterium elephantis]ORA63296.1 hypothetical protein BST23_18285 [Mycolicibacterium elephantis]